MRDVVVTGRGVVSPVGNEVDAFFDALTEGRSGVVPSGDVATSEAPASGFDPETWMTPREIRKTDRYGQFAIAAGLQAWQESGLADGGVDPERLGVIFGTGIGGITTMQSTFADFFEGGPREVSPHFITMMMSNAAAGLLAIQLGAFGPSWSVSSACASGAHAIGDALRTIQLGDADVMVAGASEATLCGIPDAAFGRMGALSKQGISRPFDERRDGFVMGEGAGALILEAEEHARARGAAILGRVVGFGASSDAFHMAQPDKSGRGAAAAMRNALRSAGAEPGDVAYINAHGTSTPFNDAIESRAIVAVFNGNGPAVSSTKGQIGHLLGAAGAVEAVATITALQRGMLPPTGGLEQPDPECEIDLLLEAREAPGAKLALSNSFGFGGQNASVAYAAK
jgi:3-oxoacyl-[acyl-carrier-protein] synthase II